MNHHATAGRPCASRSLLAPMGLLLSTLAMAQAPDLDTLIRRSGVILEGTVGAVRSEWNATRTQIHTHVSLRLVNVLKGELPQPTLELRLLGGTVGNITMAVIGQPTFGPGENVLLFLRPDYVQGEFPVVALEHGKLAAPAGSDTYENTARRLTATAVTQANTRLLQRAGRSK
ncbi:MAG: hypothetical protein IPK26_15675 [Planctomycetes bacterium]|nr:hypothetical protein [Planctomycetota bacterium]